jgi:hypothetical protein
MATRYVYSGGGIPPGTGNAAGIGLENGNLKVYRGDDHKGPLSSNPGAELININRVITLTASGTVTAADSGAVIIADSTTSIIVSLPATAKGLTYTLVVKQLTSSGGHAFSPVAADKFIYSSKADDADLVCTAASDVVGDSVTIVGDGADGWVVKGIRGTWA